MTHLRDHDFVNKQSDDNRWRTEQDVVDKAHDRGRARIAAIFGHVRARKNTDRRPKQHRQNCHDQATHNRVQQPAIGARRWRHFREDFERKPAKTLPQQHTQDEHQPT
jgi:hypothetical protein